MLRMLTVPRLAQLVVIVPFGKAAPVESKGRNWPRVTLRLRSPRRWVASGIYDGREFVGMRTALDTRDRPIPGAAETPLRFLRQSHDTLIAVARDRPGTAGRIGDRGARRKTLPSQPHQEIAGERRLAAEQMRAAGDVKEQPIRRIEPD